MLGSGYRLSEIYDWDHGLTRRQLEYLAGGILAQSQEQLARGFDLWSHIGPLFAVAVGVGMTGKVEGFSEMLARFRDMAGTLRGVEQGSEEERTPSQREQQEALFNSHPLFAANVPTLVRT